MIKLEKYQSLVKRVETAKQDASKAEGALAHEMKQFKSKFDCDTLSDAKRKYKRLKKEEVEAKEMFENAYEKFEESWSDE